MEALLRTWSPAEIRFFTHGQLPEECGWCPFYTWVARHNTLLCRQYSTIQELLHSKWYDGTSLNLFSAAVAFFPSHPFSSSLRFLFSYLLLLPSCLFLFFNIFLLFSAFFIVSSFSCFPFSYMSFSPVISIAYGAVEISFAVIIESIGSMMIPHFCAAVVSLV